MIPVPPNPLLGVSYHSAGAMLAANCYAPQKFIRRWSWETYWLVQAAWCWLLWPILGAAITIPALGQVLAESPKDRMLYVFLLGVAYGVGGTAFNLSIRYIGFALTYAIAVGLSSVLGTFVAPLVEGSLGQTFDKPGAGWVMGGVAMGVLGIALCGMAGHLKESDYRRQTGGATDFSLARGLAFSLVAGILSAVYGIAINDVAKPIIKAAADHGAGDWQGNVAYLFANTGAFVTSLGLCVGLAVKNRSFGEYFRLGDGEGKGSLWSNYGLAFLTGTLWYGQFFFYNLGHVRMGDYQFTSWAIHMIMLVLFSNLAAVFFREWKNCSGPTRNAIGLGLAVLLAAVLLMTYGNYLGGLPALSTGEEIP